jgi:hypothetical protein
MHNEQISINLMNIFTNIIKYYIQNKKTIDIDKNIEKYKENAGLLDNNAIFLRILDKHLINFNTNQYLDDLIKYENMKINGNENIKKLIDNETKIVNLLEEYKVNIGGFDLGIETFKIPIKKEFLNNIDNLNELEKSLIKLQEFHKNLLNNYGKFNGNMHQDNLMVKKGKMFEYFKLSDSLLKNTNIILKDINDYSKLNKDIKTHNNTFNEISKKAIIDISELYELDNDLLQKIEKDISVFFNIEEEQTKCKEN